MDNYESLCRQWAQKLTQMDHEALTRIPGVTKQDGMLILNHYGLRCGVDCASGQIRDLDRGLPVSVTERLNIYTLFGYWQPTAHLTGRMVSFRELRGTAPFDAAFRRGILEPLARMFTGKLDTLRRAMTELGGIPLPRSDCGGQLEAFACMPVQLLFWDADEEFPAQANLLFDASATDFIHPESIVSVAMIALRRLAETAGIAMDDAAM